LFARSLGETTDIVEKEMYSFADRDETGLTLRPEATAGVVRAYLESGLAQSDPSARLYYRGPMFRRERPQRGRYRQFYQIGAEVLGRDDPLADAELLVMLDRYLACAGSTTTAGRPSRWSRAGSARRTRWAAAGATTGWWRRSAGPTSPASASRSASSASPWWRRRSRPKHRVPPPSSSRSTRRRWVRRWRSPPGSATAGSPWGSSRPGGA